MKAVKKMMLRVMAALFGGIFIISLLNTPTWAQPRKYKSPNSEASKVPPGAKKTDVTTRVDKQQAGLASNKIQTFFSKGMYQKLSSLSINWYRVMPVLMGIVDDKGKTVFLVQAEMIFQQNRDNAIRFQKMVGLLEILHKNGHLHLSYDQKITAEHSLPLERDNFALLLEENSNSYFSMLLLTAICDHLKFDSFIGNVEIDECHENMAAVNQINQILKQPEYKDLPTPKTTGEYVGLVDLEKKMGVYLQSAIRDRAFMTISEAVTSDHTEHLAEIITTMAQTPQYPDDGQLSDNSPSGSDENIETGRSSPKQYSFATGTFPALSNISGEDVIESIPMLLPELETFHPEGDTEILPTYLVTVQTQTRGNNELALLFHAWMALLMKTNFGELDLVDEATNTQIPVHSMHGMRTAFANYMFNNVWMHGNRETREEIIHIFHLLNLGFIDCLASQHKQKAYSELQALLVSDEDESGENSDSELLKAISHLNIQNHGLKPVPTKHPQNNMPTHSQHSTGGGATVTSTQQDVLPPPASTVPHHHGNTQMRIGINKHSELERHLTEDDLFSLASDLSEITKKYHDLAIALRLKFAQIDEIQGDRNLSTNAQKLLAVLREDIRSNVQRPLTWNKVIEALESKVVCEPNLARRLKQKITGSQQ